MSNLHRILGLPPPLFPSFLAPQPVIKKQRSLLAKCWHPDKHRIHPGIKTREEMERIWAVYRAAMDAYPANATTVGVGDASYLENDVDTPEIAGDRDSAMEKECQNSLFSILFRPQFFLHADAMDECGPRLPVRTLLHQLRLRYTTMIPPYKHPLWDDSSLAHSLNPAFQVLRFVMRGLDAGTDGVRMWICDLPGDTILTWMKKGWADWSDLEGWCVSMWERHPNDIDPAKERLVQVHLAEQEYKRRVHDYKLCMAKEEYWGFIGDCWGEPEEPDLAI